MALTGVDNPIANPVEIYSYNSSVYVKNVTDASASITVSNIAGQSVYSGKLENTPVNKIDLNLNTGYYVISVVTDSGISTEKVFIK
ncbi:MAG: T9SS type A sorting domain-containing protein [Bacteroidales bacterium]